MKKFVCAFILGTALFAAPAMANSEDQHNTHGYYSYYKSDREYSDVVALDRTTIADIQRTLHELGYDAGPIDGVLGKKTRGALKRYQKDNFLHGDGRITERTLKTLDLPGAPKRYRSYGHTTHRYN